MTIDSSYSTIAMDAVGGIAEIPTIELQVIERRERYMEVDERAPKKQYCRVDNSSGKMEDKTGWS